MKRREFIALVGKAAVGACPLAVQAQQPMRVDSIGYLSPITAALDAPRREAFLQGLREHGYIEGQNINVQWRFAAGQLDQLSPLAMELIGLKVDLVVAAGGDVVARSIINASSSIPVVMTNAEDPVAAGFVASLARPGRNVTGLTTVTRDLSAKRLEVLKDILPKLSRVSVLWNPDVPGKSVELRETESAAQILNIEIQSLAIRNSTDVDNIFEIALKARSEAIITLPDPVTNSSRTRIIEFARTNRLATMFSQRPHVDAGGLVSYGPSLAELFRRAAAYVDKILKGVKAGDLPVEQPTKLELVINLKTAKILGVTIPSTLVARADEVIE